jgi:hypothetical protein
MNLEKLLLASAVTLGLSISATLNAEDHAVAVEADTAKTLPIAPSTAIKIDESVPSTGANGANKTAAAPVVHSVTLPAPPAAITAEPATGTAKTPAVAAPAKVVESTAATEKAVPAPAAPTAEKATISMPAMPTMDPQVKPMPAAPVAPKMPMADMMKGHHGMPMMNLNDAKNAMPMMGNAQEGMTAMMNIMKQKQVKMQQKQAMMQAHMKKMETHTANIEALLRELVALQQKTN